MELVGHNGQLVLGLAVLETTNDEETERGVSVESAADVNVHQINADGSTRKNFQVLKLQSRKEPERKNLHSAVRTLSLFLYTVIIFQSVFVFIDLARFPQKKALSSAWVRTTLYVVGTSMIDRSASLSV